MVGSDPGARPSPLRERRQQQTLLEISSAAVDLFSERGFSEITVEEIARAAGVSVGTFHRYFPSKEHAVCPVLDAGWKAFMDAFAASPRDEPVLDSLVGALSESLHGEIAVETWASDSGQPIVPTARTCLTHIGGCLLQPANHSGTTT